MSEIEIKQMQEKINAGILLARKRLIEKVKKKMANWSLSGMENRSPQSQGPQITPLTLKQRLYPRPYGRGFLHVSGMRKSIRNRKAENIPAFLFSLYTTATIRRTHIYNRLSRLRDIRPRY